MLQELDKFLNTYVLVTLLLIVGLGFGIASRFVQFRYFRQMFGILRSSQAFHKDKHGHLSSFQALLLSVAGRVGGGNIAGVAIAITAGGPGAIFWMWVLGLVGMGTSFLECTLAQVYKRTDEAGTYRGGPAHYIIRGIGKNWKWLAVIYSVLLLVTYGLAFNGLQANIVSDSLNDAFDIPVLYSGIGLTALVAVIVFGGIKRIARFSEIIVPIMAAGYLILAAIVIVMNLSEIPALVELIVKSAFGWGPVVGGGLGAIIMAGVKRGLFSNEAGLGSAPNVAAVAYVPHPVNQGIVQSFSVFIDTIVICTATAFIVLLGHGYDPADATKTVGTVLTQQALANEIGPWGNKFVSIALFMFGFSTMLYNYYLGENSLNFLTKGRRDVTIVLRFVVLALIFWGSVASLKDALSFSNFTMGFLAVSNLIALILLMKTGVRVLNDFERQRKAGRKQPVFVAADHPDLNLDHEAWALEPEDLEAAGQQAK